MKAFLSHSSKDKGFVEAVAGLLRPGTYELDSLTFDKGTLNSQAILESLKRSDLFCLFLSTASVTSAYVDFETLLGVEFFASGKVGRFLAICLDVEAFEKASTNVKLFNIVRRCDDEGAASRLIQGYLVSAAEKVRKDGHPFLGREDELRELEAQVTDHKRPHSKALFISGNFGTGRRTLAQKFYEHQFPNVGRTFATINLEPFAGLDELYRRVLAVLRPAMQAKEFSTRIQAFEIASSEEKTRQIAQLLNSLLSANEAAYLIDKGGILTDAGNLTSELNDVFSKLEARPHPPAIVISPRMIPKKHRRSENDISYLAVKSLKRESAERLIAKLLKDRDISADDSEMQELIRLSDCHPFNIYQLLDEIRTRGIKTFLVDPSDFIDWKHRQSSDYLAMIDLNDIDMMMLGLLKQLPELDFSSIVEALNLDSKIASDELLRLSNLHLVEASDDIFSIAPALQIAVERDRRLRLSSGQQQEAMKKLAQSLSIRLEDGTAPVTLVDAAVLSALDSGTTPPSFASAFLLPSHYVWIAKRRYDQKNWTESIRFAKEALKSHKRLSAEGFVAACRYVCLPAARLGENEIFDEGIKALQAAAKDDWARSNLAFLKGINLRFKGSLPQAESCFREAYALSPGNLHAARELAEVCLARDNLDAAEQFAREAYDHGPTNPYLLDTLISVLVRKHGRSSKHISEINDLFDVLERVGDQDGKSFFTTRKAEFEHLWGDNRAALKLIDEAVARTPTIFEPRRLMAQILLKAGNKTKANEIIHVMREMVTSRNPNERRSNYRAYLETNADYLVELGKYNEAKEVFDDANVFTIDEKTKAVRKIEIAQAYEFERTKAIK